MIVAGWTHDSVALIYEGVGALDHIAAFVMLLRGKISHCLCLICIDITDSKATKKWNHCVTVGIKKDCRGCVCVYLLVGNIDLGIDTYRQHLICRVGIVAVMMNVGITFCHIRIFFHYLGGKCFYWKLGCTFALRVFSLCFLGLCFLCMEKLHRAVRGNRKHGCHHRNNHSPFFHYHLPPELK